MTDKEAVKKNMDWYYANLDTLLAQYRGRYLAFSNGTVISDADSFVVAAQSAIDSGHELGTFAVHLCIPRSEERPIVFNTRRVDFSKVAL